MDEYIYPFERRRIRSKEILKIRKIPVLCLNMDLRNDISVVSIEPQKNLGHLIEFLQEKVGNKPYLYLFFKNLLLYPITQTMLELYEKYNDFDGFLHISYTTQNCFSHQK